MRKIKYSELFLYVLSAIEVRVVYHDAESRVEEGRVVLNGGFLNFISQTADGYHSTLIDEEFYDKRYHIEVPEDSKIDLVKRKTVR